MLENTGVAIKVRVFPRTQINNSWGRNGLIYPVGYSEL